MTLRLLLLSALFPVLSAAQVPRVSAGVAPDTVTVGDHFVATVRVSAPPGARVEFPAFRLIEPVQAADSVRVVEDSSGVWTATYTLAAWVTSESLVATFPFRIRTPDGRSQDHRVRVVLPEVRSVLPADTTKHVPRPAKAVLPIAEPAPDAGGIGWLPRILAVGLLSLIIWGLLRTRGARYLQPVDPRKAALASLMAIEGERYPGRGLIEEYHTQVSRVLRHYLSEMGGLGEEMTSAELLRAIPDDGMDQALRLALEQMLAVADRVKFSGGITLPDRVRAVAFGAAVRDWIVAWPPEIVAPDPVEVEAA